MLVLGTFHYGNNLKLVINAQTSEREVSNLVKKYPELETLVYVNSNKKSDNSAKDTTKSGQAKRRRKRSN